MAGEEGCLFLVLTLAAEYNNGTVVDKSNHATRCWFSRVDGGAVVWLVRSFLQGASQQSVRVLLVMDGSMAGSLGVAREMCLNRPGHGYNN